MSSKLQQIQFYKQYPECIPFIGSDFEKTRILLLGESHFWNKKYTENHNPEEWYKNSSKTFKDPSQRSSINIVDIINDYNKYKSRRTMFGRINDALEEAEYPQGIQSVAFMNTFQRPAIGTGNSIKKSINVIDIEKSIEIINQVIEIIKPKHICFVSRYAYKKVSKSINFKPINAVVHPTCAWWNRKTKKGINGRESFAQLLHEYKQIS